MNQKINSFLKKNRKKIFTSLVLVVIIVFFFGRRQDAPSEFFVVQPRNLIDEIVFSGTVDLQSRVDLGFAIPGRVNQILVSSGDSVSKGQVLARLSMNSLQSELIEAQSALQQVRLDNNVALIDRDSAVQSLNNTIQEQDTLVQNARRALLNEGLEAFPVRQINATPPIISGTYTGIEEGEYLIRVYNSSSTSGYSFELSGLEAGLYTAETRSPGPLGTKGLFIQFSDNQIYTNTEWVVSIPNQRAPGFTLRNNSYQQSLATRNSVVTQAQNTYQQTLARESQDLNLTRSGAAIQAAEARVEAVRSRMQDGIIVAPFDGFIARVDISENEIAGANTPHLTVVGGENFEVILFVPEIDVGKIQVGDQVFVSLDAYANGEEWLAEIYAIDIIDTLVDGVSVYKTYARIVNPDDRIRAGMNAKSRVVVAEKQNILAVPLYFVRQNNNNSFEAHVVRGEGVEVVEVVLGLRSSDGFVEIVEGLSVGDTVVFSQ